MKNIDENKIIPIIRQNGTADVPTFLKSKLYINFSKTDDFEFSYDELVRSIHNSPLFEKPPIGNNPFKPIVKEKLEEDIDFLHTLLENIMMQYESHDHPWTSDLAKALKVSRTLIDIGIVKLIKLGYVEWYTKNKMVTLIDKGKFYLMDNGFVHKKV